jgi:hypothetical protein
MGSSGDVAGPVFRVLLTPREKMVTLWRNAWTFRAFRPRIELVGLTA